MRTTDIVETSRPDGRTCPDARQENTTLQWQKHKEGNHYLIVLLCSYFLPLMAGITDLVPRLVWTWTA